MSRRNPVNIYLSDAEMKESKSSDGMEYIIAQNNKMVAERDEMKLQIILITTELREITEENEQNEKTIINLKGFVKNLGEINKSHIEISNYRRLYQKDTAALLKSNYNMYAALIFMFVAILMCEVVVHLICSFAFTVFVDITYMSVIVMMRHEIKDAWRNTIHKKNKKYDELCRNWVSVLCESQKELKALNDGNDFLNDLIDVQ